MGRPQPYVFCRYQMSIEDEELDANEQADFLEAMHGEHAPYSRVGRNGQRPTALIMSPDSFDSDGDTGLTWSVGYCPGIRVVQGYDSSARRLNARWEEDSHIRAAVVVALPELGVMAIEDRNSEEHISAKQAISAIRSILNFYSEGEGSFDVRHGDPSDVDTWLKNWNLIECSYTIKPLNPISASDLAERRSDAMKRENINRETGKVSPPAGKSMQQNGGIIEETNELAKVGYGARGFRGRTPDGHIAQVKKPIFHDDRHKNLKEQAKEHFVRVAFDVKDDDRPLINQISSALKGFYLRENEK